MYGNESLRGFQYFPVAMIWANTTYQVVITFPRARDTAGSHTGSLTKAAALDLRWFLLIPLIEQILTHHLMYAYIYDPVLAHPSTRWQSYKRQRCGLGSVFFTFTPERIRAERLPPMLFPANSCFSPLAFLLLGLTYFMNCNSCRNRSDEPLAGRLKVLPERHGSQISC